MFVLDNYLVEFIHTNPLTAELVDVDTRESLGVVPHPLFKALTYCVITLDDPAVETPEIVGEGMALCSYEDNFNKAVGRKISLTRALESAEFDREFRTRIWDKYFGIVKSK